VARLHQLSAANCFAIGDSHNDLNMLDAAHAGMIACPANSVPEIHAKISASGGLITQGIQAHGAIEALKHYFSR
jgi:hydroxymethylpyrimidine pyrophosphatase-like HAD family hydrolase